MMRLLPLTIVAALTCAPLCAEKADEAFQFEFAKTFRPAASWAVVMQPGLPTTSIYGINGDQKEAHYAIDVKSGSWKTSEGLLDTDQTAADTLRQGEVMELEHISYKKDRIELRLVSLEAHKVTRGGWLLSDTKPEPVATYFKFFTPWPKEKIPGREDVPEFLALVGEFLKPFSDEAAARSFGATLLAEGTPKEEKAPPTVKREIKVGMTHLEVIDALGKPESETSFEATTQWKYPDLTVIFEAGKVKDVRF